MTKEQEIFYRLGKNEPKVIAGIERMQKQNDKRKMKLKLK